MTRRATPLLIVGAPALVYAGVLSGLYIFGSGWAAILGYHLAICLALGLGGGFTRAGALVRGWQTGLGVAMSAVCLLAGGVLYLLWPLIGRQGLELGQVLSELGLRGWSWLLFIAYYSLVNPWLEELFWRGWYPDQLERPLAADLLFAGYHVFVVLLFVGLPWAGLTFAVLATTAFLWRGLTRRCGGLLVPVVSHLVADVSVIIAAAILAARG